MKTRQQLCVGIVVILVIQITIFALLNFEPSAIQGSAIAGIKLNVLKLPVCGDGILDAGEECDPPASGSCDNYCQIIHGGGPGPQPPICNENWLCADWLPGICPENKIQTRTCADMNNCGTFVNTPVEMRSCCYEDWSCADWLPESCSAGGIQTRTCTDINSCGTFARKPVEQRSCCSPNWNCTGWQPEQCPESEILTRECIDLNACGIVEEMPDESSSCSFVPVIMPVLEVPLEIPPEQVTEVATEGAGMVASPGKKAVYFRVSSVPVEAKEPPAPTPIDTAATAVKYSAVLTISYLVVRVATKIAMNAISRLLGILSKRV